jgi:hypothetical protein
MDHVEDDEVEQKGDIYGRMPEQLDQQPAVSQPDNHQQKRTAKEKVNVLLGQKVVVKHKKQQIEWTVIEVW